MHIQKSYRFFTEDYLVHETAPALRSEYHDGRVVPMAPTSLNHQRIVGNVHSLLHSALRGKEYEAFLAIRLWMPHEQMIAYPDLAVVAGPPEINSGLDDTITNPVALIEVVSEQTRNCDRGEKFISYRTIPGFREYVLIDQSSVYIEHFVRTPDNKWVLSEHDDLLAVLVLSSVPVELPALGVYKRVTF